MENLNTSKNIIENSGVPVLETMLPPLVGLEKLRIINAFQGDASPDEEIQRCLETSTKELEALIPKPESYPVTVAVKVNGEQFSVEVDLLHLKTQKNPEAVIRVIAWTMQQESWAEEDMTHRRSILLDIARADFYIASGDIDGAYECLDETVARCGQEGHFDLQKIADDKITTIIKIEKFSELERLNAKKIA